MGKPRQAQFTHTIDNGWDKVILEAERQIALAEEKISGLRLSIETFKELRAKGEPFPGEGSQPESASKAA